jgi:hypothetical protein
VAERPIKATLKDGTVVDASDVPVAESIERWSEFKLEDGTVLRAGVFAGKAGMNLLGGQKEKR